MGATSVTGKGNGIAANQKGPGNNRNFFEPIVNPHIVAAGKVQLSGGSATVTIAADSVTADYMVFTTEVGTTVRATSGTVAVSGGVMTITLKGNGTDYINYAVLRIHENDVTGTAQQTE